MVKELRPAIVLVVALTIITGLVYPLVMTGIAGVIFPYQSQGSMIEQDGKVVGSVLIGQEFTSDKYFHGRPSATVAPDPNDATKTVPAPYNAANSGGSNLGRCTRTGKLSATVALPSGSTARRLRSPRGFHRIEEDALSNYLIASSVASGAMITSVNISVIAFAASASSLRLSATIPPNAEVESQASALR